MVKILNIYFIKNKDVRGTVITVQFSVSMDSEVQGYVSLAFYSVQHSFSPALYYFMYLFIRES